MRLITHNMLASNVKGVENGFPLVIEATATEERESEFSAEFVENMLPKLEWQAFTVAAAQLGLDAKWALPDAAGVAAARAADDEAFLRAVHHVLLDVHVLEGNLICPESGRRFPISNGIPNMLLHEDEV